MLMTAPMNRKRVLPGEGFGPLLQVRQHVQEETHGRIPERLLTATVAVALQVAHRREAATHIVATRVLGLVRDVLRKLNHWQSGWDTRLFLQRWPVGSRTDGRTE